MTLIYGHLCTKLKLLKCTNKVENFVVVIIIEHLLIADKERHLCVIKFRNRLSVSFSVKSRSVNLKRVSRSDNAKNRIWNLKLKCNHMPNKKDELDILAIS